MNPAATANVAGDTLLATSGDIVVENGTLNAGMVEQAAGYGVRISRPLTVQVELLA